MPGNESDLLYTEKFSLKGQHRPVPSVLWLLHPMEVHGGWSFHSLQMLGSYWCHVNL